MFLAEDEVEVVTGVNLPMVIKLASQSDEESLGAVALPREEYLGRLPAALRLPAPDWSSH